MSFRDNVPYGIIKVAQDKIHSIDKLIIDYYLDSTFDYKLFCSSFSTSSGFIYRAKEEEGYNSYFDKKPSSYFSWFGNGFWFPHVNVKYGLYRKTESFIGPAKITEWKLTPLMRLEFNPNKCMYDDTFICLIVLLKRYVKAGELYQVDYAVDIPCKTSDIVTQSRKDKVIYNNSRYYGKRHTNGRLKIYDKRKEILDKDKVDIGEEVTRSEITCKENESLCFDSLYICCNTISTNELSSNLRSIASLIMLASSYGEDWQELLYRYVPDKRNRDKLIPVIAGNGEKIFNLITFLELLSQYCGIYDFIAKFTDNIIVNKNGYTIGDNNA